MTRRLPYRDPLFWAFLAGVAVLTAMRPLLRRVPAPPSVTGQLPPVSLVDQAGHPFGGADWAGHVHIATAVTLPCTAPCPEILAGMRRLQAAYRERSIDAIRLLAIVGGPDRVDADRLATLATQAGAEPGRWQFVTGERRALAPVWASLTSSADASARPLVIIDSEGRLRGHYAVDPLGLDEVYNRAQHVLHEARE